MIPLVSLSTFEKPEKLEKPKRLEQPNPLHRRAYEKDAVLHEIMPYKSNSRRSPATITHYALRITHYFKAKE